MLQLLLKGTASGEYMLLDCHQGCALYCVELLM